MKAQMRTNFEFLNDHGVVEVHGDCPIWAARVRRGRPELTERQTRTLYVTDRRTGDTHPPSMKVGRVVQMGRVTVIEHDHGVIEITR